MTSNKSGIMALYYVFGHARVLPSAVVLVGAYSCIMAGWLVSIGDLLLFECPRPFFIRIWINCLSANAPEWEAFYF